MSNAKVGGINGDRDREGQRSDGGTTNSKEQCKRDELYYLESVVFKVEDTLFRVPKKGFCVKDTVIGDMFLSSSPRNEHGVIEGSTDEFPIVLENNELRKMGVEPIKKADFQAFLRVMYPFTQTPLTYEEWVGALHLSSMWFYTEIRNRAIASLNILVALRDACSNIVLAKKYGVRKWLIDGYTNLVVQLKLPILDDLCAAGIDPMTLARIYYIRNALPPLISASVHSCTRCGQRCLATAGAEIPHHCRNLFYHCSEGTAYCTGKLNPSDTEKATYRKSALLKIMEVFAFELTQLEV
ncbi:hypothetical protein HYPSUDRAFT_128367 [Hypholoma sublateritium FD-334 SS-4]|uniref:BTB domain-containing protein n=1 Tax=Hypholoma sublateritium (strain FD-334 SS-4) TaxID=945553 RepID=A0A0D2PK70_HYPSF|nr:hypothetical protein HYPSUDRAFT_128367 [Hypholoma sublateritium FD-334 SS-4]